MLVLLSLVMVYVAYCDAGCHILKNEVVSRFEQKNRRLVLKEDVTFNEKTTLNLTTGEGSFKATHFIVGSASYHSSEILAIVKTTNGKARLYSSQTSMDTEIDFCEMEKNVKALGTSSADIHSSFILITDVTGEIDMLLNIDNMSYIGKDFFGYASIFISAPFFQYTDHIPTYIIYEDFLSILLLKSASPSNQTVEFASPFCNCLPDSEGIEIKLFACDKEQHNLKRFIHLKSDTDEIYIHKQFVRSLKSVGKKYSIQFVSPFLFSGQHRSEWAITEKKYKEVLKLLSFVDLTNQVNLSEEQFADVDFIYLSYDMENIQYLVKRDSIRGFMLEQYGKARIYLSHHYFHEADIVIDLPYEDVKKVLRPLGSANQDDQSSFVDVVGRDAHLRAMLNLDFIQCIDRSEYTDDSLTGVYSYAVINLGSEWFPTRRSYLYFYKENENRWADGVHTYHSYEHFAKRLGLDLDIDDIH